MIGFIVKHGGFGLGKVAQLCGNRILVDFISPPQTLQLAHGAHPVVRRHLLPLNTICSSPDGRCRIVAMLSGSGPTAPHRYQVELDSGLQREISEIELTPLSDPAPDSPLEALTELHLEGYATFQKREQLADTLRSSIRVARGLRALLSSRIDLRPHQAYVAGTVLMDRLPRYLLADEVGLGKTIEAGIVIHDFLEQKPRAKILILSPSTLTQQWLCELYSKFSGRVFRLLDLREHEAQTGRIHDTTIASYQAALKHNSQLLIVPWDLVVVDEAHHLLSVDPLYAVVQDLSEKAPACLLLSAVPAQHREDEYLRLLALLEPKRYRPNEPGAKASFSALYTKQIELGRKLSYLSRHLAKHVAEDGEPQKLITKLREIASLPPLSADSELVSIVASLTPDAPSFVQQFQSVLHYVGDRYRISRRILRNRRSQLLDTQPDLQIVRRLRRLPYEREQFELDAANAVRRLLLVCKSKGGAESALVSLARILFQSLCDPECLLFLLETRRLHQASKGSLLELDGQVGYQYWNEFVSALWSSVTNSLPQEEWVELLRAAKAWQEVSGQSTRLAALISFLSASHKSDPSKKFIIFAGFFGLCQRVARALQVQFGNPSVSQFRWDQEDQDKEKAVVQLKRDDNCWLLVSDETGGEGRNFQFVNELIHFDMPWHVARVEQRIGRLDRLGRRIAEVCSNVLHSQGGEDHGLVDCLENGFEIFTRSVSGLEFALSHLERSIALAAIEDGYEGVEPFVKTIKQEVARERVEDDVQAMLDAASMERVSAEVFMSAQSTPERDQALERAFCEYFQFIGGKFSVRHVPAGNITEGVVEFDPNQVRDVTLKLRVEDNGGIRKRCGTFRREIAQERPDLEFFSVGNEFFDAFCGTLHQSVKGRTYAVECGWPKGMWRGFEFAYRPVYKAKPLESHPGLVKHLERVFAVRIEHCFVGEDLRVAKEQVELLRIRKALQLGDKDLRWHNFTLRNNRVQLLPERYPNWAGLVARAEAAARSEIRERFKQLLCRVIEAEGQRIQEQIRQARLSQSDEWEQEVAGLEALLEAISGWDLEMDIAGFLSVNGGLIA